MSEMAPIFGFQEFWPKSYEVYGPVFEAFARFGDLTNRMLAAADAKPTDTVEKAVYFLTRLTAFVLNDVVLLCGNGSGTGAMKIVRGMFETSTLAEYLRRNPKEVDDYVDFGRILSWRRYQWLLAKAPETAKQFTAEKVKELESEYNRVASRFTNNKGKIRNQWTTKSIGEMAQEMGRTDQYELVYSLGCSIHHANFEGLTGYIEMKDDMVTMDGPPSFKWTGSALIAAHTYLLFALDTLNECCKLAFDEETTAAGEEFNAVWKGREVS